MRKQPGYGVASILLRNNFGGSEQLQLQSAFSIFQCRKINYASNFDFHAIFPVREQFRFLPNSKLNSGGANRSRQQRSRWRHSLILVTIFWAASWVMAYKIISNLKVMTGLWKNLPSKINHKVSENWISASLLFGPLIGVYTYVQPYRENEKLAHTYVGSPGCSRNKLKFHYYPRI